MAGKDTKDSGAAGWQVLMEYTETDGVPVYDQADIINPEGEVVRRIDVRGPFAHITASEVGMALGATVRRVWDGENEPDLDTY